MIQDKKFLNETIKKSILSNIPMQDVCNGKTSENRNLKELKQKAWFDRAKSSYFKDEGYNK